MNQFRKLEDIMMDPIEDEGFYREMISFLLDWNMKHLLDVIKAGSDSIEIGGNLAGSGVGPKFFADYVMEYEKKLAGQIHDAGAFVVYHNCGDAQKIMHLYNDLDIDVWGYVTTAPFGDVVLDDALKTIRPDMALRGNIDQVEFMIKATPAQIKERIKELFDKVKSSNTGWKNPENPITFSLSIGMAFFIRATPVNVPFDPKYSKPNFSIAVPILLSTSGKGAGVKSIPLNSMLNFLPTFSEICVKTS